MTVYHHQRSAVLLSRLSALCSAHCNVRGSYGVGNDLRWGDRPAVGLSHPMAHKFLKDCLFVGRPSVSELLVHMSFKELWFLQA